MSISSSEINSSLNYFSIKMLSQTHATTAKRFYPLNSDKSTISKSYLKTIKTFFELQLIALGLSSNQIGKQTPKELVQSLEEVVIKQ